MLVYKIICTFHVPAFFIISGLLIKEEKWCSNLRGFVLSRIKSLLIPYFLLELNGIIFHYLILRDFDYSMSEIIIRELMLFEAVGATWFLTTLFVAELIFIIAVKYSSSFWKCVEISVCVLVITFFDFSTSHEMMLVGRFVCGICFLLIGNVLRNKIMKANKYWIIGAMLIVALAVWVNGLSDMYSMKVGNGALYVIGGISGTYLLIQLIKKCKWIENCRLLIWAEINALIILGTHQLYIRWIERNTKFFRCFWGIIGIFILVLLFEAITVWLLKTIKYSPNSKRA